jgi:hypothetical protein
VLGHEPTDPPYLLHMRAWVNGIEKITVVPSTLPDDTPIPATHEPDYPQAWKRGWNVDGYTFEVLDDADPQEVRVAQAVRDFGLLTSHRDHLYAISIGMDWDGFTTGIVAPEADTLALDGAGIEAIELQAKGQKDFRPKDQGGMRSWRKRRGCGAVGWGLEVGA